MIETLSALSKNKLVKEEKKEILENINQLNESRGIISNMPLPEKATIKEIISICNEILNGKLIWSRNIQDRNSILIGSYSKNILELIR